MSKVLNLLLDVNLSKGRQGDLNYEAVPLSPFLNPPIPSHVRGACDGTIVPHAFFLSSQINVGQILKFHERVISALKFELNEVQPKFSSLLRRVSKILKFAKTALLNL